MSLRLANVSYLNACPLVAGLHEDARIDLVEMPPSDVSRALLCGDVHGGLVPVVSLLEDEGLTYIPGICIGADGPVDSVLLYRNHRFEGGSRDQELQVVLDPESRTSQMLARIVIHEIMGISPDRVRYREDDPLGALDCPEDVDGVLVIGDKALDLDPGASWNPLDLAGAWKEHTGLPFVFAVWGVRSEILELHPWLADRMMQALDDGMAGLADIAGAVARDHGTDAARAEDYLRHRIVYRMGDAEEEGLKAFLARIMALENGKTCWT